MQKIVTTKNCLLPKYEKFIWNSCASHMRLNRLKVLAYVPFGSYSMGLNARVFDFDFLGIYEDEYGTNGDGASFIDKEPLPDELSKIDWLITDIKLLKRVVDCDIPYHTLVETKIGNAKSWLLNHNAFDYSILPGENSCKLASVLSDMCYYGNGYITDMTGYILKNSEELQKTLRIYDFCKRRFVSVVGRLKNYMIEPHNVRLRSYLYSLNELYAIKYSLKNAELPAPLFSETINQIDNKSVKRTALEYYELNSKSEREKEKLLIDPNPMLNDYIREQTDQIAVSLKRLFHSDRNAVYDICFN